MVKSLIVNYLITESRKGVQRNSNMSETNMQDTDSKLVEGAARGPKGDVGKASAGLQMRNLWHATHFSRVEASDRAHPNRKQYVPNKGAPSLKVFARKLAKEGNKIAEEWLDSKLGLTATARSEANATKAKLSGQATKTKRRTKKGGGK